MAKPPKRISPKHRTALVKLAEQLGGKALATEVATAADTPDAYLAKFAARYEGLEDEEPGPELPWLALVEGLEARKQAAEVDWKEAGSEVLAWLESIGGAAAKRALKPAHEPHLDDRSTDEALALFGRHLAAAGLALVQLDKPSDSFALMVVPAKDVAGLVKLARTGDQSITRHTGEDLAALEQERFRRDKKSRTTNPWGILVEQNAHRRGTSSAAESVLEHMRHDLPLATVKAALPFAPVRDQPLIAMTVAIYEQPASQIARRTTEPELCLRALEYLEDSFDDAEGHAFERLAAAAILAERLHVKPDHGKRHFAVCAACNLWANPAVADAALARLPSAARARLARLADGMLVHGGEGSVRWYTGFLALNNVGDAISLPMIATLGERAVKRLARTGEQYADSDQTRWETATKRITARLTPRRTRR